MKRKGKEKNSLENPQKQKSENSRRQMHAKNEKNNLNKHVTGFWAHTKLPLPEGIKTAFGERIENHKPKRNSRGASFQREESFLQGPTIEQTIFNSSTVLEFAR